jgi:hypothetical protein
VAKGLVHHPIDQCLGRGNVAIVHLYPIVSGFDTLTQVGRFTVDQHTAGLDQALTGPTGADP